MLLAGKTKNGETKINHLNAIHCWPLLRCLSCLLISKHVGALPPP